MPDLRIETMDISGEFLNLEVTSGIVQKAEGHSRKCIFGGE